MSSSSGAPWVSGSPQRRIDCCTAVIGYDDGRQLSGFLFDSWDSLGAVVLAVISLGLLGFPRRSGTGCDF